MQPLLSLLSTYDPLAPVLAEQLAPSAVPMVRTPESRLLHAILEQAAFDLLSYCNAQRTVDLRIHYDAWRWMRSGDRTHPFSFVNVCETLGYCPAAVRGRCFALLRAARRPALGPPG